MAYDYDALYKSTPNALGEPTPQIRSFFEELVLRGRILDVGCGQGRDALFLARMGHDVTGVDLAPSGVADMLNSAKAENLPIKGDVADITAYHPDGIFDIVLVDRTLHMLDQNPRLKTLTKLAATVAPSGYLLLADEKSNMAGYKETLGQGWGILKDEKGYLFLKREG